MSRKARIITIVTTVILLPVILLVEEDWRGRHGWERYRRELESKGEHFNVDYFVPPPVPDEQNFVMAPIFLPSIANPDAKSPFSGIKVRYVTSHNNPEPKITTGWYAGSREYDLEAWQKYYRKGLPSLSLHGNAAEDVLAALAKYDPIVMELREAARTRPLSRAPVKFQKNFDLVYYPSLSVSGVYEVLALRIQAELELGRPAEAYADLEIYFRFSQSQYRRPGIVQQILYAANVSLLIQPVWNGISMHQWTDEQLQKIQAQLKAVDFLGDFAWSIRAERAKMNPYWDEMRSDPKYAEEVFSWESEKTAKLASYVSHVCPGLIYFNQTAAARYYQDVILPLAGNHRVALHQAKIAEAEANNDRNYGLYNIFARTFEQMVFSVLKNSARLQADVDLAYVACAIERYRLAHGSLPASLGDLADIPCDVMDGKPLRYHVLGADNYLLYSIGWDGVDNGGKPRDMKKPDADYDIIWTLKPIAGTNP